VLGLAAAPAAIWAHRESFRTDDHASAGSHRGHGKPRPARVAYQLTDNERLLRDLAYPLIEPRIRGPHEKPCSGDYQPMPGHGGRRGVRP